MSLKAICWFCAISFLFHLLLSLYEVEKDPSSMTEVCVPALNEKSPLHRDKTLTPSKDWQPLLMTKGCYQFQHHAAFTRNNLNVSIFLVCSLDRFDHIHCRIGFAATFT